MSLHRFTCRLFGHRWEFRSRTCLRCKTTAEELVRRGSLPRDPLIAYEEGYEDGLRQRETLHAARARQRLQRGYRLGFMRGGRDVFSRLEKGLRR